VSSKRLRNKVVLVDLTGTAHSGHYAQTAHDAMEALSKSRFEVTLLAPYALDSRFESLDPLTTHAVQALEVGDFLNYLQERYSQGETEIQVLVLWWRTYFLIREEYRREVWTKLRVHLHVITNASAWLRNWPGAKNELQNLQVMSADTHVSTIYAWDYLAEMQTEFAKLKHLPEFHRGVPWQNGQATRGVKAGFYGLLSAQRGLVDLYFSALLNPNVLFRVRGYPSSSTILTFFRSRKFINSRSTPIILVKSLLICLCLPILRLLPNVDQKSVAFQNDQDLVADMAQNDCVFFATDRSPYSSGMSLLALASGIRVIWIPGNSAANDNLSVFFPAGRISRHRWLFPYYLSRFVRRLRNHDVVDPDLFEAFRSRLVEDLARK